MKYLRRPAPFLDESFFEYLLRLSNYNGYQLASWIYYKVGTPSSSYIIKPNLESLVQLSDMTGVNIQTYHSMLNYLIDSKQKKSEIDAFIMRRGINSHSIKICPLCFKESSYYRAVWDINVLTVCHVHKCFLINRCLKCKSKIFHNRITIDKCNCGFDFCNLPILKADPEDLVLPSLIEMKLKKTEITSCVNKGFYNPLYNLSLEELIYLIIYMVRVISYFETKKKVLSFHADTSDKEFIGIISRSVSIFNSWPYEFYKFLDKYSEVKRYKLTTGIRSNFGTFQSIFLKSNSYGFIKDAFSEYIHKEWSNGHHLTFKKIDVVLEDRKYISGSEASRLLKTPWNKVKKLIEINELQGKIQKTQRFCRIFVSQESINDYMISREKFMYSKEVKNYLGICHDSVKILEENSLISRSSERSTQKYTYYHKTQVIKLLDVFDERLLKNCSGDSKCVNSSFIIRELGNCFFKISVFFKLVIEGVLIPRKKITGNGINQYLFDKFESKNAILKYKLNLSTPTNKILSSVDFSTLIGVNNSLILSWIKLGLIPRGNSNMFCSEDIKAFNMKYITLKEIKMSCNIDYREIRRRIDEIGVKPVSGEYVDGSKGYLYLRSDLVKHNILKDKGYIFKI
ncbi:TniQ family protein [Paenibacillus sp. BC26]|uniref:TniQ family protein n=1 Tax=Paenibacillus sp. BC26 TaxID=1881032 RepID=UPI0015A7036E|nr:TniQ family protein [Paenibacillus sp. BC26]